jgi:hypothetical protein
MSTYIWHNDCVTDITGIAVNDVEWTIQYHTEPNYAYIFAKWDDIAYVLSSYIDDGYRYIESYVVNGEVTCKIPYDCPVLVTLFYTCKEKFGQYFYPSMFPAMSEDPITLARIDSTIRCLIQNFSMNTIRKDRGTAYITRYGMIVVEADNISIYEYKLIDGDVIGYQYNAFKTKNGVKLQSFNGKEGIRWLRQLDVNYFLHEIISIYMRQ